MAFIIWGVRKANIAVDELLVKCPSCETDNFADVMVQSNYYHVYFIPIAPFEKEASIICHKCGLKRYEVPFLPKYFKDYYEIKSRFKHPWYTYSLSIIISMLILSIIFFSLLKNPG